MENEKEIKEPTETTAESVVEETPQVALDLKALLDAAKSKLGENKPVVERKTAESVIEEQRQADLQRIGEQSNFQELSHEIAYREVNALLSKEQLDILTIEQQNKYREYALQKEIEKLDYIARHEHKIIKEGIKAELYQRKKENAIARYGYLYTPTIVETIDKNGERVEVVEYKDFTISKTINRFKEFNRRFKNLSAETRKVIFTMLKTAFWLLIALGVGFGLYGLIKWLIDSGVLNLVVGEHEQIVNAAQRLIVQR